MSASIPAGAQPAAPRPRREGSVAKSRKQTATSTFGVGRREAHDASDFYARFSSPTVSSDDAVQRQPVLDEIWCSDARDAQGGMKHIRSGSVALVVTSPPYFAGKDYELELGTDGIPATYRDYLQMLTDVFAVCVDKLEPGGRIAVNVANLGRKPYRSLSADVIAILQDRLGLLLRGEVIWRKARGAGGNCAWGSFQSARNPVLRDVTERVVVASKGRFDRARTDAQRTAEGLGHGSTITRDEFMEATLDLWELAPERATRVGHPAPFPVELPQRFIELYTYAGDVVLDPFMGSGSTAVAALRTGRHYLGFDTDAAYVAAAKQRIDQERSRLRSRARAAVARVATPRHDDAVARGTSAVDVAAALLDDVGFTDVVRKPRLPAGLEISLGATDAKGRRWYVMVAGGFGTVPTGLRRGETLWRTLGQVGVLRSLEPDARVLVLTPDLPIRGTPPAQALAAARGATIVDALPLPATDEVVHRLTEHARGRRVTPLGDLLLAAR
jgi:site-specific DNA-methyltransferase (adenine-specific)